MYLIAHEANFCENLRPVRGVTRQIVIYGLWGEFSKVIKKTCGEILPLFSSPLTVLLPFYISIYSDSTTLLVQKTMVVIQNQKINLIFALFIQRID